MNSIRQGRNVLSSAHHSQTGGNRKPKRADYGLDAPHFVYASFIRGVAGIVIGATFVATEGYINSRQMEYLAIPLEVLALLAFFFGFWYLSVAVTHVWGSRIGKVRVRDKILNQIEWRGDEAVLDVGCGGGLMAIGAAKRLSSGKAVGVDIWSSSDQSGNRPERTIENTKIEGVSDRVELSEGDARKLPFQDSVFDIILSSLVIHNIRRAEDRMNALREIVRVLKLGGKAYIFDLRHANEYAAAFRSSGMKDVRVSRPTLLFMNVSGPMLCRITTARR